MTGLLKVRSTTLIRTIPRVSSATSRKLPITSGSRRHARCLCTERINFLSHRPLFSTAILPLLFEGRFHPKSRTQGHKSPERLLAGTPQEKRPEIRMLWPHFFLSARGYQPVKRWVSKTSIQDFKQHRRQVPAPLVAGVKRRQWVAPFKSADLHHVLTAPGRA